MEESCGGAREPEFVASAVPVLELQSRLEIRMDLIHVRVQNMLKYEIIAAQAPPLQPCWVARIDGLVDTCAYEYAWDTVSRMSGWLSQDPLHVVFTSAAAAVDFTFTAEVPSICSAGTRRPIPRSAGSSSFPERERCQVGPQDASWSVSSCH